MADPVSSAPSSLRRDSLPASAALKLFGGGFMPSSEAAPSDPTLVGPDGSPSANAPLAPGFSGPAPAVVGAGEVGSSPAVSILSADFGRSTWGPGVAVDAPSDAVTTDGRAFQSGDDPVQAAVTKVDFRPFDMNSRYIARAKHYQAIQNELDGRGKNSYYFAAVSGLVTNLANMDASVGGLDTLVAGVPLGQAVARLSPRVRRFSEGLSTGIAQFNDMQLAAIRANRIAETGAVLDHRLVVDEQNFIEARLDALKRADVSLYRDFIAGVNRNANVKGVLGFADHVTDFWVATAADHVRARLGRPIDFSRIADRIMMGDEMVAMMKLRHAARQEFDRAQTHMRVTGAVI